MLSANHAPRILLFCILFVFTCSAFVPAQTYTELLSFDGNTAAAPFTSLVQGMDGSLFGFTLYGGTGTCFGTGIGCGIFFKITRGGRLVVIYNFQQNSQYTNPSSNFVLGNDGSFYGPMSNSIVRMTPNGSLTTLYTFTGSNGSGINPAGPLIQSPNGNFYGTTEGGGETSKSCPSGCGTIYELTPQGVLTTLHSFCLENYCPDGKYPRGGVTQVPDGNFYGTTYSGGLYQQGTFFKITPNGVFTNIYTFDTPYNFYSPGLILATDGNFYGASDDGLYQLTPQGTYTQLPNPGNVPNIPVQATDGNFYGTTQQGGTAELGNVFETSLAGTPLYSYSMLGYPNDGSYPYTGLVQATDGKFYGTTFVGGNSPCNYSRPGCGTIFALDSGLAPFVKFVKSAARVGQRIGILGQGLVGTTSVSLHGTSASFVVESDTLLVATVPPGATTGYVSVATPRGTLASNIPFYVIK
jgi:uncharacterized repeat protein (TIGR03803 family)